MTRPRTAWLRPFTNRIVNPISRRVAGRLPWFGIIVVPGRTSGSDETRADERLP